MYLNNLQYFLIAFFVHNLKDTDTVFSYSLTHGSLNILDMLMFHYNDNILASNLPINSLIFCAYPLENSF